MPVQTTLKGIAAVFHSKKLLFICIVNMAKRKNLTLEHGEGYSGHAIARKLKISVHGVQAILNKAAETGNVKDKKRSGHS